MKYLFLLIGAIAVGIATFFVLTPPEAVAPEPSIVLTTPTTTVPVHLPTQSSQSASNASIRVGTSTYPITVTGGETVIAVMNTLAQTADFAYTSRDYPGLGTFVDSINGKANADGMYWILYVNGVSATGGASITTLSIGDTVEWRYTKGY